MIGICQSSWSSCRVVSGSRGLVLASIWWLYQSWCKTRPQCARLGQGQSASPHHDHTTSLLIFLKSVYNSSDNNSTTFPYKESSTMVDIPERTESHGPVFIYGVEGEQIEEENDAYNDLRYDIGKSFWKHATFAISENCLSFLGQFSMNNLLICHELLLEFNGNNSQDRQLHCSNNVSIHCQVSTKIMKQTKRRSWCHRVFHCWYLIASSWKSSRVLYQAAKKKHSRMAEKNIDPQRSAHQPDE